MNILKKTKLLCVIGLLIIGLVPFSFASTSVYAAEDNTFSAEQNKYSQVSESEIESLLSTIENIPDNILESGSTSEANDYLEPFSNNVISPMGAWECSLAIAGLVVTTAVPIAKLAKIKKLVKSLGGGVKAAKIIFGASLASEKWSALGGAAKDLVLELAGITSVKKACFG
ncbi:hypothetical protein [Vagococcus fluvialis]|uniref:hypothetical protein n=1 Tax=Vagococcus fluvialis TaxID=2738 RepID=UPI0037B6EBB6